MELEIDNNKDRVLVEHRWWRFSHPVLQAKRIGDRVLVIFDYMSFPSGKPKPNLRAYDLHQKELWVAENPDSPAAAYINFIDTSPLKVWNFACYTCTLDIETGKLIEAHFTK